MIEGLRFMKYWKYIAVVAMLHPVQFAVGLYEWHIIRYFAELVLDNMMASKQLEAEHRERVQEVLLSRHRHQHEKEKKGLPIIRSLADIGKKHSSKTLEDRGE